MNKGVRVIYGLVQHAQTVIDNIKEILPFPISLSDHKGYIIGDSNSNRIGMLHTPSIEVLRKRKAISFDEEKIKQYENVLQGVAVPLNFHDETLGVLGIIGPPEEVWPHVELIKNYVEIMWQDTFQKEVKGLEERSLETFVQYLIHDAHLQTIKVKQFCDLFQLNYHLNYYCIVIDIGDAIIHSLTKARPSFHINKERFIYQAEEIFQCVAGDICTFLNTEKIVVIKAAHNRESYYKFMQQLTKLGERFQNYFQRYTTNTFKIAAGTLVETIEKVSHSYEKAEWLLRNGRNLDLNTTIYNYFNWEILTKLLPFQLDDDFYYKIRVRLKNLFADELFPQLKRDFLVYCECHLNVSEAARELFLHRNTLIYRLNKIEELTSLNMRNFNHCALLYIALKKMTAKTAK
ncbi:MAG TPA: sugar diacid recognition domain-containing protein [Bacillota bacterium]|nr:sugar diacid recognition domain-containing protein [Bacillota bacterium]